MNHRQVSKLKMYQVVLSVCNKNADKYIRVPALVACVNELADLESSIKTTSPRQAKANSKGITKEKNITGDMLMEACLAVSNPLYVYALDSNNLVLMEKSDINKNTLYNTSSSKMLEIAKIIAGEATIYAHELINYGVEAADRNALDTALASYETLISGPRTAIIGRKRHTGNLVQLFATVNSLLTDKIDRLIVPFKKSAPEFYTDYINARNIIDTGGRSRLESNDNQPPKIE